ncbi:MAG: glycerol-3-phosphate 1-O-acyltransferase PlsY [Micavibrio sp.]|nr:glycerol-3-phosphate 1-O-acyltransferase PlsY [Micavibrio sp.]
MAVSFSFEKTALMLFFMYIFPYLIGSIPVGLILSKVFLKKDIRTVGSGNIGATNVLRTGSKKLAIATLFLDLLKGALPIMGAYLHHGFGLRPEAVLTTGMFIILGHCFPVWLKFKGGKGVATAFGVLIAAVPLAGAITGVVWISTIFITRISSLGALAACAIAPIATYFIYGSAPAVIVALISALVIARHHANIMRLLNGEEQKFGKKKDKDVIASE